MEDDGGEDRRVPGDTDAMPQYKTTYDIEPHAGDERLRRCYLAGDQPRDLAARRGGGNVSFIWFRTTLTIPPERRRFRHLRREGGAARSLSTITPRSGSTARCRAAPAGRARRRSKASTCPTASCSPICSSRATVRDRGLRHQRADLGRAGEYRLVPRGQDRILPLSGPLTSRSAP